MEHAAASEAGNLNPLELRAWRGLIETTALLRLHADRLLMADSGLSGSDYPVLVTLHERGDQPVRSTELAELIGWEQSRLSHHLARMERRGLIHRRTHRRDTRGSEVLLTPTGRAVYLQATTAHSQAVRTLFADVLTVDQLEGIFEAMDTLRRHLGSL